jgi:hypothetical protein
LSTVAEYGATGRPAVVEVDVAVEVVARPEDPKEPAHRLESQVRTVGKVVDPAGWCVGHEDVEGPAAA